MAVFTGNGSAASPSLTFSSDTNTGIFRPGVDQLGLVTNGATRLFINATGQVGIGTASPGALFDVAGQIKATSFLENVFTITDAAAFEVNPSNGNIQLVTLGATRTPKATNFLAGQRVTLMIDPNSTARSVIWTDSTWGSGGVQWVSGTAPLLATSGFTVVELWKVGSTVYGAQTGRPLTRVPTSIGSAYAGGFFAGQINDGGVIYNLIVAPKATGENTSVQYKTSNTADTPSTTSQNQVNGALATAAFNDANHPAFQWASALTIGSFSDWYIPAKNELEIIYRNLKPTTDANSVGDGFENRNGSNPNAVPSPTPRYTGNDPAQTSSIAFLTGGSEAFASASYWSSSETSSSVLRAWGQNFGSGFQVSSGTKISLRHARAVRRVLAS